MNTPVTLPRDLQDPATISYAMNNKPESTTPQPATAGADIAAPLVPLTYTLAETATVLAISESTVHRWLKIGRLKALPGLRHKRISRRQVHELANGGGRHD